MAQPLESRFEKLLGRTPSPEEREKLFRVKDALGLGDSNSIWLILMALGHYEKLYEEIPANAEQAAQAARKAADSEIKRINAHAARIRAESRADLAKIVARNSAQQDRLNAARVALAAMPGLLAYALAVISASFAYNLPAGMIAVVTSVGLLAAALSAAIAYPFLRTRRRNRQGAADRTAARRSPSCGATRRNKTKN